MIRSTLQWNSSEVIENPSRPLTSAMLGLGGISRGVYAESKKTPMLQRGESIHHDFYNHDVYFQSNRTLHLDQTTLRR